MATRALIARLAQRIEALRAADSKLHIIAVSSNENEEQALADYEMRRGRPIRGQVCFIVTGVPRSPDWGKW